MNKTQFLHEISGLTKQKKRIKERNLNLLSDIQREKILQEIFDKIDSITMDVLEYLPEEE